MRGHGRLLTAAGLIAAGALAGCSSAAGTSPGTATATHELPPATPGTSAASPTATSSASTSISSPTTAATTATSAAAPTIPAAARAHTPEGAEAFTRYFIDQVNVAWTTPKTGLISALSLPTCKSCARLEQDARRLADAGARVASPMLEVNDTIPAEDNATKATIVVAQVTENPKATLQGDQTTQPTRRPTSSKRAFELTQRSDGWRVSEIKDYQ
ncbi:DUF6318 family protein [Arsenicicoccus bolidensis]|uniref:DUF6318 family protein n=1 Tax=Arsenicicoccus bolidensis TaxID=229480 RepID=A0ABS9PZT9_9MICO|nr:DUF6318 family protein [Arsenicicoccus bolidensis]MCG7321127.1 DUF6318 family protein [Arsenicicoccus bolidensis]